MPDERSRMMVSQAMSEKFGPEFTAALMECVPPFAWTEIATKADLDRLQADFVRLEQSVRGDVDRLERTLRSDIKSLRLELLGAMEAQGSRTLRWTVGSMFAAVTTLSAAMAGIAALAR